MRCEEFILFISIQKKVNKKCGNKIMREKQMKDWQCKYILRTDGIEEFIDALRWIRVFIDSGW